VMAHQGSPHGPGMHLGVRTAAGASLVGAHSPVGAVWPHARLHRRLGSLRAAWGGRAAPAWEGTPADERAHAHSLAHTEHAVGTPDALLCQDRAQARRGALGRRLGDGSNSSATPSRLRRTRGHVWQGEG